MKLKLTFAFAALALAVFLTPDAWAQTAGTLDVNNLPLHQWFDQGNSANALICGTIGDPLGLGIFGSCTSSSVPGAVQNLLNILRTTDVLIMMAASMYFGYGIWSKSVSAATEGEWFGKSTHNAWMPLRLTTGATLILPVFKGFNMAQVAVLVATAAGIGAAGAGIKGVSMIWPEQTQVYTVPNSIPSIATFAPQLQRGFSCMADMAEKSARIGQEMQQRQQADQAFQQGIAGNYQGASGSYVNATNYNPPEANVTVGVTVTQVDPYTMRLDFGASQADPSLSPVDWGPSTCGSITAAFPQSASSDQTLQGMLTTIRQAFFSNLGTAAQAMGNAAAQFGKQHQAGTDMNVSSVYSYYFSNFNQAMQNAATQAAATANSSLAHNDPILGQVQQGDWIGLGFEGISNIPREIESAQDAEPTIAVNKSTPPALSAEGGGAGQALAAQAASTAAAVAQQQGQFAGPGAGVAEWLVAKANASVAEMSAAAREITSTAGAMLDLVKHPLDTINRAIAARVMSLGAKVAGIVQTASDNPLVALGALAVTVIHWVGTAIMAILAFQATLVITVAEPAGVVIQPAVSAIMQMTWEVMLMLAGVCALAVFSSLRVLMWMPFILALQWLAGIMNWLTMVLEGMFAVPFWAMLHLGMDGEEIGSDPSTKRGYVFLTGILFMPLMMVGTYFFIQGLMSVVWVLFKGATASALANLSAGATGTDWLVNLCMIVGAVVVLFTVAEWVVTESARLINVVPRAVLSWIDVTFNPGVQGSAPAVDPSPALHRLAQQMPTQAPKRKLDGGPESHSGRAVAKLAEGTKAPGAGGDGNTMGPGGAGGSNDAGSMPEGGHGQKLGS